MKSEWVSDNSIGSGSVISITISSLHRSDVAYPMYVAGPSPVKIGLFSCPSGIMSEGEIQFTSTVDWEDRVTISIVASFAPLQEILFPHSYSETTCSICRIVGSCKSISRLFKQP